MRVRIPPKGIGLQQKGLGLPKRVDSVAPSAGASPFDEFWSRASGMSRCIKRRYDKSVGGRKVFANSRVSPGASGVGCLWVGN